MQTILSIQNLTKNYGKTRALDQLSLEIHTGEVFGLLGPNGSGKTTTLGIILGILQSDSGGFTWFENRFGDHFNQKIGAILETPNFYPYLNALDNLKIIQTIKKSNEDDLMELLTLVDLQHRATSKFKTYSLGMKQRLAIAATLIGKPEVLIFDEPTNGLDPRGIAEVREILQRIASTGKTVIMASHMLDEVEKICDHVAIIKNGKLLASGKIGAIIHHDKIVEISAENNSELYAWIKQEPWVKSVVLTPQHLMEIQVESDFNHTEINHRAFQNGFTLNHLVLKKKRLEEEFLQITKN